MTSVLQLILKTQKHKRGQDPIIPLERKVKMKYFYYSLLKATKNP